MLLNQTIVSDVAQLNLDFLLCDDSLQCIDKIPKVAKTKFSNPKRYSL